MVQSVVFGAVSSSTVDFGFLALTVLAFGAIGFAIARRFPALGLAGWLVVIAFVPVWVGISVVFYLTPATAVGFILLAVLLPVSFKSFRTPLDLALMAFFLACLLPIFLGSSWTVTSVFVVLTQWGLAYAVGRIAPHRIDIESIRVMVAWVFAAVAVVTLLEFATSWNPFVLIPGNGDLYTAWSPLQSRGGVLRAEGAFGHSIALASSMAMVIPLVYGATRLAPWLRLMFIGLLAAATVVTFSRVGLVEVGLAVTCSLIFIPWAMSARMRIALAAAAAAVAAAMIPLFLGVLEGAGSEATSSANYRGDLTSLIGYISTVGFSSVAHRDVSGGLRFGSYRSIDNALLLLGLTYGWVALILAILLLFGAVIAMLRFRATPETVGVVSQIPALFSVALITQYATVFWFVAGLAVFSQVQGRFRSETRGGARESWDGRLQEPDAVTAGPGS